MELQHYFRVSRQARYSVSFALPLLLLYEGLAAFLPSSVLAGVRNGADVLLKTAFVVLGGRMGLHLFALALVLWGVTLVINDLRRQRGAFVPKYLAVMLGESFIYAALLGVVVANLTSILLSLSVVTQQGGTAGVPGPLPLEAQLVVSLGAGLYEELLFRVLLVSGLLALGKLIGLKRPVNVTVAVIVSALIFSAFHYVGPLGDPWEIPSFTFRAVAGLVLSGLYVARGFGIAAWTHALYDIGFALRW